MVLKLFKILTVCFLVPRLMGELRQIELVELRSIVQNVVDKALSLCQMESSTPATHTN